jgi:hypothetical protein
MQMANSKCYLDGVKLSSCFIESLCLSQVHEQLTATDESHYKEDLLVSHENVTHTHKEWVISLKQDIFFQLG